MKIIDEQLLNKVSAQAKDSPRLRMNFNFHQSLDEKCHRFINAVEPGTEVPIHKHPTKDETFVILRGKVRVTTHRDDGSIIENVVLCAEEGRYGVNIPKGVWHTVEAMESYNQLIIAADLQYIDENNQKGIQPQIDVVARMLNGLRATLKKKA